MTGRDGVHVMGTTTIVDRDVSGSALTSLDALETSADPLEVQSAAQWRIHRPHWEQRDRIIRVLHSDSETSAGSRIQRMSECCRTPIVGCSSEGEFSMALSRCRDRLCPLCANFRARECAERIEARVRTMVAPRFLTLTLREDGRALEDRLDRLAQSFRRLRERDEWKRHVRGGIYAVQVTRGAQGQGWHVHLHVIWDGEWWHQGAISDAWEQVTGDSPIVDVRAVVDRRRAGQYISRYVAHTDSVASWADEAIIEYARAMKGRRTLHTFGDQHGASVDEPGEEPKPNVQRGILSVSVLLDRVGRDDPDALLVYDHLRRASRAWRAWLTHDYDRYRSQVTVPLEEWEIERARAAWDRLVADVFDHRSESEQRRDEVRAERSRRRERRRRAARAQRHFADEA